MAAHIAEPLFIICGQMTHRTPTIAGKYSWLSNYECIVACMYVLLWTVCQAHRVPFGFCPLLLEFGKLTAVVDCHQ